MTFQILGDPRTESWNLDKVFTSEFGTRLVLEILPACLVNFC